MRRNRIVLVVVAAVLLATALYGKHRLDSYEPSEYVGPPLPPPAHVAKVGDTPAPIDLRDLSGKTVRLGGAKTRTTLVHFWASWCLPCVAELPTFESARAEFEQRGIDLITVALDDVDHAQAVVDAKHLTLPVLISDGASVDPVVALGSAQGAVPFNAAFDRSGKLILAKVGTADQGAPGVLKWLDALK